MITHQIQPDFPQKSPQLFTATRFSSVERDRNSIPLVSAARLAFRLEAPRRTALQRTASTVESAIGPVIHITASKYIANSVEILANIWFPGVITVSLS